MAEQQEAEEWAPVNPADEGPEQVDRLGDALRAARLGEALPAGDGELLVRYYEARLVELRRHMTSEQADAIAMDRVAQGRTVEQLRHATRNTELQVEQLQRAVKRAQQDHEELRRLVQQLVGRIENQFGPWHREALRSQLANDPQLGLAIRLAPRAPLGTA